MSDQSCINSCEFKYSFGVPFVLPADCSVALREQCSVVLTFDYVAKTINFKFGSESSKQRTEADYATDKIITSVINLEEPPFIQHTVKYYCSTEDRCDITYVEAEALPLYSIKSCEHFRPQLIQYLNPNQAPSRRECVQNDNTTLECDLPCELLYENSNQIIRACDDRIDLSFETTVGQSTPINRPQYNSRRFNYACTMPQCNGIVMQIRIQRLINSDSECIIALNNTSENTTPTSSTTTPTTFTTTPTFSTSTPPITTETSTEHRNHATTFSKSFILIVFILFFVHFFP